MKRQHITAFYLETVILIVVFVGIILILTRVFGIGKKEGESARILTDAVSLSENAAEAIASSGSPQEVADLLNSNGNAWVEEDTDEIWAVYGTDRSADPNGPLRLQITWEPEIRDTGTLVSNDILVWYLEQPDPVYTLQTAVFVKEGEEK